MTHEEIEHLADKIADGYAQRFVMCCAFDKAKRCMRDAALEVLRERLLNRTP